MKNNKKLQNRLNITINDYREYSQLYSPIEIKLTIINGEYGKFDNFINIPDEDKAYYHIYFDNNANEEIKRNYLNKDEKVEMIKIIIDYQIESFERLFYNCIYIKSIYFT